MSYVERVLEANPQGLSPSTPFVIDRQWVGEIASRDFLDRLLEWPQVFVLRSALIDSLPADGSSKPPLQLHLTETLTKASLQERAQVVGRVLTTLRDDGVIPGWRDEDYVVNKYWGQRPQLFMERAAIPYFGIRGYGVHLNGYVHTPHGIKLWVARRSMTKASAPGKLDHLVGGGQPVGLGLLENLYKECAEEAGIPRELAMTARSVGALSYTYRDATTVRPDVIFCFDLALPADFVPQSVDSEVASFTLCDLQHIDHLVQEGTAFKFNSALVVIDFFIRHGWITPEHPDYLWLCQALRGIPTWPSSGISP